MSTELEKEQKPLHAVDTAAAEPAVVEPAVDAAAPEPAAKAAAAEPPVDPMEDTDRIQKAIERVVDEETAALPPLPLSGISGLEGEEPLPGGDAPEYGTPLPNNAAGPDGRADRPAPQDADALAKAPVHTWFFTFMCMNIPIAGWIYLLYLAFNKKKTERRNFARAYLFYKLVFLLVSALILGILIYIGLGYLDQLLAYMEML